MYQAYHTVLTMISILPESSPFKLCSSANILKKSPRAIQYIQFINFGTSESFIGKMNVNVFYLQTFYQKRFLFKHILEGVCFVRVSSKGMVEHLCRHLYLRKHICTCHLKIHVCIWVLPLPLVKHTCIVSPSFIHVMPLYQCIPYPSFSMGFANRTSVSSMFHHDSWRNRVGVGFCYCDC